MLIENWRPLSMLACDYKIFAKVIANRMSLVMDYLISNDQSGFMKGRYIAQNLIDLNCILKATEQQNIPATLISIDFHKAYDTIERECLYSIMRKFNFGDNIISWVKVCMSDNISTVINNGYFKSFFPITRGFRQGDPLSCYNFNLVIEIIATKIKQNKNIEGVEICKGIEKKLGQYADDMWLVTKHKNSSYKAIFKEFELYSKFCGLKINYNKTEILRLGSLRNSDAEYISGLPIKWSDGPIKILGIQIMSDLNMMGEINYSDLIQKTCAICSTWSARSLSLLGKIIVVNTLILPLFNYRTQVLSSPSKNIIQRFKAIIKKFLWESKKPKIAYDKLISSYEKGGLKLHDLSLRDIALKGKWIIFSQENEESFLNKYLNSITPFKSNIYGTVISQEKIQEPFSLKEFLVIFYLRGVTSIFTTRPVQSKLKVKLYGTTRL